MITMLFVLDHLWQSTLFAAVVAVVAARLRRANAGVRHLLWTVASAKFLVPFAILTSLGGYVGARAPLHVPRPGPAALIDMASAPPIVPSGLVAPADRPDLAPVGSDRLSAVLVTIWAIGAVSLFAAWLLKWVRVARIARRAAPLSTGREARLLVRLDVSPGRRGDLTFRQTSETIEPGVFGVIRPMLLWPAGLSDHLSDDQIETILLHELNHVRRRDNLLALVHTLVQTVCWFHPMVWWIGVRLIDERERACDEAVITTGRDRQVYAESVLKTCQFCLEAPVTCMAGVTGSDLKRRVTNIMTGALSARLGAVSRVVLAVTALVVVSLPIIRGAALVPQLTGSGLSLPDPAKVFAAASVRQNKSADRSGGGRIDQGRVSFRNTSVRNLVTTSFRIMPAQIVGGPEWMTSDRFDIVAKADGSVSDADTRAMLENLLTERFAMKAHIETRNLPIYALRLANADGKLGPDLHADPCAADSPVTAVPCSSDGLGGPGSSSGVSGVAGGGGGVSGRAGGANLGSTMSMQGTTMAGLARSLSSDIRLVVDETGLTGRYSVQLRYSLPQPAGAPENTSLGAPPELFTAVREQLGLKLEATRGPVDVLVIDSIEHPTNDDFVMPDDPVSSSRAPAK